MKSIKDKLTPLWQTLYPNDNSVLLDQFCAEINKYRVSSQSNNNSDWYKDAVVYSLYVDLFNKDFYGLANKLDYLQELGVSCLWLLPILDSPMRDAGFDIRDYKMIRADLLGVDEKESEEKRLAVFRDFLHEAHSRGIRVIFDIAINHTSDQHPWFIESGKGPDNPYRDYYIWNKDTNLYKKTRLLFEGMCPSNWEKKGDWYYFHRFFEFQPDLNYKNPKVLVEMCRNFLFWVGQGVDGFRADAIPYLWKEDGTDCENLPHNHVIVKFFRAVLEYVKPGTLLLAEACQPPVEVVKYIGSGDECHAGYNFPLMPQIFKAIEAQDAKPIRYTLSEAVTPAIPESSQWFTFLRCHDELSLEKVYVNEEDRAYIHTHYCHRPEWDFRLGQGISARLSNLMNCNPEKIILAFSIMLSLPGTPVIYYGDEFAKLNDEDYYRQQIKLTGKNDSRFLVRGHVDWEQLQKELKEPASLASAVFPKVKQMINIRNNHPAFGRGNMEWVDIKDFNGNPLPNLLAYKRSYKKDSVIVLQNISAKPVEINARNYSCPCQDILNGGPVEGKIILKGYSFLWLVTGQ